MFGNQGTRAATDNHYPKMSTPEICLLPVESVAADNSHLYLWVTAAHLADGLAVMKAWGFQYKQYIVWAKTNADGTLRMGLGNYWRHCTELILFGTRGKAPVMDHGELNLFWAERPEEHSRKPDVFRDKVEIMSPGPYLEMFARYPREGWTLWGNEAPQQPQLRALSALGPL